MNRTLLINALIYFGLLSLIVGILSFITGGLLGGFIPVRIIIAFILAKLQPIVWKP
jgi:hypothetical protein